mmetsp:Transcript_14058/g.25110  ORF Transcript_14058/g.25110 Transcript_14058/m.25110 type:complete len:103 (-) Transcript_14058:86-394(-)
MPMRTSLHSRTPFPSLAPTGTPKKCCQDRIPGRYPSIHCAEHLVAECIRPEWALEYLYYPVEHSYYPVENPYDPVWSTPMILWRTPTARPDVPGAESVWLWG